MENFMGVRKEHAQLLCQLCGSIFTVEPYRAQRAKFCGLRCKQVAAARRASETIIKKYRGTGKSKYVKCFGRHMHRVVAEQMLGRALRPGEIVHHKDGNGHNNSPENLEVMFQPEHVREHYWFMMRRRKEVAGY